MSLWKSLSLSREEESFLVTLDPEAEIAPLGKSPPLSVSPRIDIRNPNTGPWRSSALRWLREVSERQRFMAEQLPPLASSSR